MKVYSFKAVELDHVRWTAEAKLRGITFGEWVRRKLNEDPLPLPDPPPVAPVDAKRLEENLVKPLLAQVALKKGACEHRLPPGTYCKRCRKLKR